MLDVFVVSERGALLAIFPRYLDLGRGSLLPKSCESLRVHGTRYAVDRVLRLVD